MMPISLRCDPLCSQISKMDYWQNLENFFSGEGIFGGQNYTFDLKILFSENLSEWLFLIVISVKLKVNGTKVVSVFEFGPYFGSKWLFLSFFGVFT